MLLFWDSLIRCFGWFGKWFDVFGLYVVGDDDDFGEFVYKYDCG